MNWEGKLPKWAGMAAIVAAVVLLPLVLPILFEAGSLLYLLSQGESAKPFLYSTVPAVESYRPGGNTSYIDPILGFAPKPRADLPGSLRWPGFAVYGNEAPGALRIVTLGGSTTDPGNPGNWPRQLHALLASKKIPATVFNGGVAGYSSSQELLKLVRDVMALKPHVVIALNGVNDLGYLHNLPAYPLVHRYQFNMYRGLLEPTAVLLPNASALLRRMLSPAPGAPGRVEGLSTGTRHAATPEQVWRRNVRRARAIGREMGSAYLVFLQPLLGDDIPYKPTKAERAMLRRMEERNQGLYLGNLKSFYAWARRYCKAMNFCVDLTGLYSGSGGMYANARHPNAKGYGRIAVRIYGELAARKLLKPSFPWPRPDGIAALPATMVADEDFSRWNVENGVEVEGNMARAPDGSQTADRITFPKGGAIFKGDGIPVAAGEAVTARIWLWSEQNSRIGLMVARHCDRKKYEGTSIRVTVNREPLQFQVTHRFLENHDCARLQLNWYSGAAKIYAWGAGLERK